MIFSGGVCSKEPDSFPAYSIWMRTLLSAGEPVEKLMHDSEKTKEQLIQELAELRARVADLENASGGGRREDETYHALFDHFPQGVAIFQDWCIVYANQTLARQTGYSVEEMLSGSPEEIQERLSQEIYITACCSLPSCCSLISKKLIKYLAWSPQLIEKD